jgi:predicted alpha/beta-fold hydrolase
VLTAVYRPKLFLTNTVQYAVPLPHGVGSTYIYDNYSGGAEPAITKRPSKAIIMLHGLGSSHGGTYMSNVAAKLVARGERVIRVDLPGCGPSANLTWLPGHAGCSEEVWGILDWCHQNLGIDDWRAVGFSLGGNVLLRMLATRAEDLERRNVAWTIASAVAVAPPIDLAACCDGMESSINRWYARHFIKILIAEAKLRATIWPQWAKIDLDSPPKSIREFDDRITSRLAGFRDASEYYREASSSTLLKQIFTPTTLLCDRHDPIVQAPIFESAIFSPKTHLEWTRRGGHLGYLYRTADGRYARWADDWVVERLTESSPS